MKIVINHSESIKKLTTWLIIISCFGYPLTLSIGLLLNVNIGLYNILVRILIAILALIIISYNLSNYKISLDVFIILFILFWISYLIRLVVDLEFKNIRYLAESPSFIYLFAFGGVLLPCFAIITTKEFEELNTISGHIFRVLIISNILILIILFRDIKDIISLIQLRSEIYTENENGKIRVLNGITISLQGSYLLVYYFGKSLLSNKKVKYGQLIIFLSVVNMIIGASRGPLLNSIISISILLGIYIYKNGIKSVKIIFFIMLSLVLFIFIASQFIDFEEIAIVNRILLTYEYGGAYKYEYRKDEWSSAINQFIHNPFIGDQFVVKFDNAYPHNIFLEVAMSLGLLGLAIFTPYLLGVVFYLFTQKQEYEVTALLILTIFTYQLSGGIFSGISFWLLTLFYLKYYQTRKVIYRI